MSSKGKSEKPWKNVSDISEDHFEMLQDFVILIKHNYKILDLPPLKFFKDWLENDLGATIPKSDSTEPKSQPEFFQTSGSAATGDAWNEEKMEEEEDTNIEIDREGVISGDTDPPQEMGDDSKEVTEAEEDEANNMKMLGIEALNGGDSEGAITHLTSGIKLDCSKTVLFIKRATAYLRLSKPNAAIRDAEKALKINPDSAAALKVFGKAQNLLGKWEEACHHLEEAQKIDFDDNIVEILKEIKPKASRIRDHRLSKEREKREREIEEKMKKAERIRKAQEQARKEQEERDRENMAGTFSFGQEGKFGEGMPGFGEGMPGSAQFATDSESEEDQEGPKITEVVDDLD